MPKLKDLTGQKFGRLTALYKLHNTKGRTKWLCACECGNLKEVLSFNLVGCKTKSCGCYHKERDSESHKIHGKRQSRLYIIWKNIKQRCYNKNRKDYIYYGARGIAVCDKWKDDFMAFYEWAMNNGYDDNLTIDRIDVNSNYSSDNCRWVDMKQQNRNKRNIKQYTINGETHCLSEWCDILCLNYGTVKCRLSYNWSIEKALELK